MADAHERLQALLPNQGRRIRPRLARRLVEATIDEDEGPELYALLTGAERAGSKLVEALRAFPDETRKSLISYVLLGAPVGCFLTAVLRDSLSTAVLTASGGNMLLLHDYVRFLHDYFPDECWGSAFRVGEWARHGGLLSFSEDDERMDRLR